MRNRIGSLVAAVIAAVLTLLAAPVTEAIALAPAESPSTYIYDSQHHPAPVTGVVSERGPPATHSTTTDDGGVRSLGDLARPNEPTTPATYDYNDLGQLAQIARGCKLAEERADGAPAALAVVQRSGVAAKTTTSLADEASGLLGNADDVVVLGRQADTAVAKGWDGHVVLDTPNWSLDLNDAFIRGAIDQRRSIYLASPLKGNLIQTSGRFAGQPTVYARELQMLREAGYTRVGDYMVPR